SCRECRWDRWCHESALTDALRTTRSLVTLRGAQSTHRFQHHALCGAARTQRVETTTDARDGRGERASPACRDLFVRCWRVQCPRDLGRICGTTAELSVEVAPPHCALSSR